MTVLALGIIVPNDVMDYSSSIDMSMPLLVNLPTRFKLGSLA